MGSMARQAARQVRRPVAADRQGSVERQIGVVRRGARRRALLRLDRRAKEGVRRRDLAPEIHAARQAEHLVKDQPRKSAASRRERRYNGTRRGVATAIVAVITLFIATGGPLGPSQFRHGALLLVGLLPIFIVAGVCLPSIVWEL